MSTNCEKQRPIVRIGHRGAAGHAPENTLASLEEGIALGAEFLEIDLQRTRDGRVVLMHDKFVNRTTNGAGSVTALDWSQLRKLDAGGGQHIPLLEEALEAASGRAGLILECITPGLGVELWQAVTSFGFRGRVIYSSFLHREILAIRDLDRRALTMALIEGALITPAAFAIEAGATHAGLALDSTTQQSITALKQAGLAVFVYTANTQEQIDMARELGADGIISDYPDRLVS